MDGKHGIGGRGHGDMLDSRSWEFLFPCYSGKCPVKTDISVALSGVVSGPSKRRPDVSKVYKTAAVNNRTKTIHQSSWSEVTSSFLMLADYFIVVSNTKPWEGV